MIKGFKVVAAVIATLALSGVLRYTSQDASWIRHTHEGMHLRNEQSSPLKKRKSNPLAILHIGPRKTATTTIQNALAQNFAREPLKKDSFEYLGKARGNEYKDYKAVADFMQQCFGPKHSCANNHTWTSFVNNLQGYHKNKNNIIISDEMFSYLMQRNTSFHLLRNAFKEWNVRIIVTYRRYYEWILSEYNQEYTLSRNVLPFVKWYHRQTRGTRSYYFSPPDKYLVEKWQSFSPTVGIFNMHQGDGEDLMTGFLCTMIPEAKQVCHAATDGKLPVLNERQSDTTLDAKMIVQAAVRAQIVEHAAMAKATAAVQRHMDNMTVPVQCLSSADLEEILELSLKIEKDLVPTFFHSEQGQGCLRNGFSRAVEEEKFCNVDAEQVLKDEDWQKLLSSFRGTGPHH